MKLFITSQRFLLSLCNRSLLLLLTHRAHPGQHKSFAEHPYHYVMIQHCSDLRSTWGRQGRWSHHHIFSAWGLGRTSSRSSRYKIWLHTLYHEINLLFLPLDPAAKEGWTPTSWPSMRSAAWHFWSSAQSARNPSYGIRWKNTARAGTSRWGGRLGDGGGGTGSSLHSISWLQAAQPPRPAPCAKWKG